VFVNGLHATTHIAPVPHMHMPPTQWLARLVSHALPQLPQLLTFVSVLMHAPAQQLCAAVHVRPHAPQLATVSSIEHVPPQQVEPAAHVGCVPH
jgi:hypothetical protein